MPATRCPSCGKEFKDHTSVARHMSQPRSGCNTWLEDLIRLDLTLPPSEDDPMAANDLRELHASSYETGEDANIYDFGNEGETLERGFGQDEDRDAEVTDYFPEPPVAFEHGYTFLSLFDSDENSIYCKTNLYYPFSSRREWQVAAWLLHSGLSMGKIDSFLALEMSPVILYWRDPIECIASIFNHPLFHDRMDFMSRKVYTTAQKLSRVYTEWMTGDHAWDMQLALPRGATLLGTILSSDKTCITALTGDRVVHPLLLSLANIHMSTRLKSSSNAFVLAALLPVPKFIHKKKRMKGMLQDRLVHQCLDVVLEPLKLAAQEGIMMSDPTGLSRYCFTLLASYIADTPEAMMLACVGGKTSPVTMAMYKQFGDAFRHEPRTRATTLAQLDVVHSCADQDDIEAFFFAIETFSDQLSQSAADAAPSGVIVAVHTLLHFHYLVQSPHIDDHDIRHISAALAEFHANKHAIISAGVCQGKGRTVINNWHIPKLELMQNIVPSIRSSGITGQWSADITEHAHITEIKDPARSSNNNNYDPQICRHLDLLLDCERSTEELEGVLEEFANENDETDGDVDDIPAGLPSTSQRPGQPRSITNYFVIAQMLRQREKGSVPVPLRSFVVGQTAFHLAYGPFY
ncbi:hypothetical protein DFH29DRAFT_1006510 [Suillus ampliporus]|nr:hypothetical protein DFH29DRAFT_1006510 [Suillus ampliporus]